MPIETAEKIDEQFDGFISDGRIGAVALFACRSDGAIYQGAFGKRAPDGPDMTMDSVGLIASMTKAVTGVAAMQCVERGQLQLDAPAGDICSYLGEVQVFDGFDQQDNPILRPPTRPLTLRHLLTHTSGFVYDIWNAEVGKLHEKMGIPRFIGSQLQSLRVPLMFDPGTKWEYGIGIDWVGQMVEAVSGMSLGEYFAEYITGPLGMNDTAFTSTSAMQAKSMVMRLRAEDGGLAVAPTSDSPAPAPEFDAGGGGLKSSARDYGRFLQMILSGGELDGVHILQKETVVQMAQNHMGELRVTPLLSNEKSLSEDAEFFPGEDKSWGLTFQINETPCFTGRSAGTLMWAGLCNCYFWIDPARDVAGLFMSQIFPFADPTCLEAFYEFESLIYEGLN